METDRDQGTDEPGNTSTWETMPPDTKVIAPGNAPITITQGWIKIDNAYFNQQPPTSRPVPNASPVPARASVVPVPVAPVHKTVTPNVIPVTSVDPVAPVVVPTVIPVAPVAPVAPVVAPAPYQGYPLGYPYAGYPVPPVAPVASVPYTRFFNLSVAMIVWAIDCYVAQGTAIGMFSVFFWYSAFDYYTGFWAGSAFLVNGIVGIIANRNQTRVMVIVCLLFCISSQLLAVTMFSLNVYTLWYYIYYFRLFQWFGSPRAIIWFICYVDLITASIVEFCLASSLLHRCRLALRGQGVAVAPMQPQPGMVSAYSNVQPPIYSNPAY